MAIDEVFPNPTVNQVIFQIKFPNLFYIESKIGEFQLRIMKEFPISNLLFRKQVVFVDLGPEAELKQVSEEFEDKTKKIWQFESPKKYTLNLLNNSLDITSSYHKTYNNPGAEHRFRDIIEFVLKNFFDLIQIPIINRIGLRYIDECPIQVKNNDMFRSWYNATFPLDRFNIQDAIEMDFKTVVRRGNHFLRYMESIKFIGDECKLILDFDGFSEDIESTNYLSVTDELHTLIVGEYERTIKGPVYDYMRVKKEA